MAQNLLNFNIKTINMKNILALLCLVIIASRTNAQQQFISKALIEFEVKCNMHAQMGDGIWEQNMKDRLPKFSTNYFDYIFSDNKAVYKFNRTANTQKIPSWYEVNGEDNIWYSDYNTGLYSDMKDVWGDTYILKDSIAKIQWKMTNEHRTIAGFDCKKAVGKVFDSVYVFAFYTDEIMVSGGPMNLSGLPGMIMGVTIPRLHTSWIATKVQVVNIDEKKIVAPTKGKIKNATDVQNKIAEMMKEYGEKDDRFRWRMFI